jgi:thiamine-monophosphate kinase
MNKIFPDIPEFSLIERLAGKGSFIPPGHANGDDGLVITKPSSNLVISTDSSVEGVHFRLDWVTPALALEKAVLSNLSDLNAMGANCQVLFFNLGAPVKWQDSVFENLGLKLQALSRVHGFRIGGGDLVRVPGRAFFSITVMGALKGRPLLRSNARPGHKIYLSGYPGVSRAGLALLEQDFGALKQSVRQNILDNKAKYFIQCHNTPPVPLGLGPKLGQLRNRIAAIDTSDGLSSELWHISRQSGVKLVVNQCNLPIHSYFYDLFYKKYWNSWVLNGGEDYQLLFTGKFSKIQIKELRQNFPIAEIGRVEEGKGVFNLMANNQSLILKAGGWRH